MIGVLLLGAIGAAIWMLSAPHMGFAPGFATLLQRPVGSMGVWPFIRGSENVGGEYRGRPVLLVLHHKRGRYSTGYLVVAMQVSGMPALGPGESIRERVTGADAGAAWDTLELNEELRIACADGWFKATWQPTGLRMFPGSFDSKRWQRVLDAMLVIVTSIERD